MTFKTLVKKADKAFASKQYADAKKGYESCYAEAR
jgi:hypothetical protein